MNHGPRVATGGTTFRLWAPDPSRVELVLFDDGRKPKQRLPMTRDGEWWMLDVRDVGDGALYGFAPDGRGPYPDPASRFQPFGVHGPSQVVDPSLFRFEHRFIGAAASEAVIYESHVGAMTPAGTFEAFSQRLDHLQALGINVIELMPVAEFAGERNWGYDGTLWFAPAHSYGTPAALAALIDAAHARGIAVILDVVYNHLGPDGNYLRDWAKGYFTDRHKTPWGDAIDYGNPAVRALAIESAVAWISDYRFDGLRLDATHAIIDQRSPHLVAEIAAAARAAAPGRNVLVYAEDERNEAALVRTMGLDGVWADDFHHEVRRIVAGDDEAWFADFRGDLDELVHILQRGWLYEGQARSDGTTRGTSAEGLSPMRFVHCIQNHDQVGNRAIGDRLHHAVPAARHRAAVTLLLASPFTPLLFMGQEIEATAPFPFFTDHGEELGRKITAGRRAEFGRFRAFADPAAQSSIPDPQSPATFAKAKIDWAEAMKPAGARMLALHQELLRLRKSPAMHGEYAVARVSEELVAVRRWAGEDCLLYVIGLRSGGTIELGALAITSGSFELLLDTEGEAWLGEGRLELPSAGAVVLRARF